MRKTGNPQNDWRKKFMRLRKNMKRTAAAALALSMAVSTAAVPASAGYTIDMSDAKITGDVEIKQEADGSGTKITISVGGEDKTTEFSDSKEDDKITITGDNTKSAATTTAAADAAEDNTKAPETTVTENKDGTVIDYTGELDAQPDQEVSRPDSQNDQNDPEADQKNQGDQGDQSDQKNQNNPEADQKNQNDQKNQSDPEADQSGQNNQNKDSEDADAGIMTYEAPAPTTLTNPVAAAIRNVIKIINKVAGAENALNITLDNATIKSDSDDWNDPVMKIAGEGDVNIELNGSNVLTSGLWSAGLEKNDKYSTGRLTIRDDLKNDGTAKTDEEKKAEEDAVAAGKKGSEVENVGSLTATGGKFGAGIGASDDQSTSNIVIEGGTIKATGGEHGAGIGGSGFGAGGKLNRDDPDDRSQTITINGGNIVANGIGGGGGGSNGKGGFGAVTINGGHIQSVNDKGAGIGGGWGDQDGGDGDVLITGGVIEAVGLGGAGIGGGGSDNDDPNDPNSGLEGGDAKVEIRGKNAIIKKAEGHLGAGIGGGSAFTVVRYPAFYKGGSAEIEITDGATVEEAVGGEGGAGIGSGAGDGYHSYKPHRTHAHVTIKNATVESAKSGLHSRDNTYGAGIGGGGTRSEYWNGENVIRIINSVIGRFQLDQNGNREKDENGNYLLDSGTGALGTHGSEGIGRGANKSEKLSKDFYGEYGNNDVIIDNSWVPDGDTTMKQEFNHDWSDTETLPTCTKDGEKGKVCSRCGMKETEKIPALGHDWGDWTVTTPATCTNEGVETRTCNRDPSHVETRTIPATGHNWVDNGNGTHTCTNCGATEALPVGALELRVVDAEGMNKPFTVSQNGTLRTYTGAYDTATLTGDLNTLRYLQDHGAQTIQFVTNGQTSSFDINDLLAQGSGSEVFYLTHRGAEEPTLLLVEADHSELVKD